MKDAEFDFFDFGCSSGGSLKYGVERLGGKRGLGLDIDPKKVAAARAEGLDAEVADVTTLVASPDAVRFVIMSHFLEHLPGIALAKKCIEAASATASGFVFIRQPWFSSDDYLASLGLKLFWSDWTGHTCKMGLLDFQRIVGRIPRVAAYRLYGNGRIKTSRHRSIHPLQSPADQHRWDPLTHAPKPEVRFEQPVFREIVCLIATGGSIAEVEPRIETSELLFDSVSQLR